MVTTVPFGSANPWLALERKGRSGVNTSAIPNTPNVTARKRTQKDSHLHINMHTPHRTTDCTQRPIHDPLGAPELCVTNNSIRFEIRNPEAWPSVTFHKSRSFTISFCTKTTREINRDNPPSDTILHSPSTSRVVGITSLSIPRFARALAYWAQPTFKVDVSVPRTIGVHQRER